MNMLSIFIIDDHLLFAEGLATMLQQSQMRVAGIFTRSEGVEQQIGVHHPDVLLLDINLDKENGVSLCRQWIDLNPSLKIIGLSMHHEYRHVAGMQKAGAKGYLFKNSSRAEIIEAIGLVAAGGTYFRGEAATVLLSNSKVSTAIDLNPKETKILRHVINGYTSRQISEELDVSIKTVEFYRNSLLIKFNVRNSMELANKARELFLV
jgi:two-component system, NarL family, response regulator NreC